MRHSWRGMVIGLAAAALVAGSSGVARAAACGDINNNGVRQINDVILLLRAVSGLDPLAGLCGGLGFANCGDINANGAAEIADVVQLLREVSGLPSCLPPICVSTGPALAGCPGPVTVPNSINTNQVWPAGCDIRIDGLTFVEPGVVLTVQAGAVIKGRKASANPSALFVKPGAKINAIGSAANPIVFTSDQPAGARAKEDWGGVTLLGDAPITRGTDTIEGLPPSPDLVFGGTDVNDNSGCMRFVRVEFSGRDLVLDSELNLFNMAAVGRNTQISHIHAHNGADDCHEWFGGTVNTKFMVASACGDDGFDTQLGTRGALQFGLIVQEWNSVEAGGSNGFEMDNDEDGFDREPRSNPKFCNVTAIGVKGQQAGSPPGGTNQFGVFSRRGNSFQLANAIVKDFSTGANGGGLQMRDPETAARACTNSTTLQTAAPFSVIRNSIFFNNGGTGALHALNHSSCDDNPVGECTCTTTQWFGLLQAQRQVVIGDASIAGIGGGTFPPTGLVPAAGSLAATHPAANCPSIDGSFVDAPYIGAFEPGGTDWTAGWTAYPLN
jgi:hypothetical protein